MRPGSCIGGQQLIPAVATGAAARIHPRSDRCWRGSGCGRSSVIVKIKRNAATMLLNAGAFVPSFDRCNWNRRMSSAAAMSGERDRTPQKRKRISSRCVFAVKPREFMSSMRRWRSMLAATGKACSWLAPLRLMTFEGKKIAGLTAASAPDRTSRDSRFVLRPAPAIRLPGLKGSLPLSRVTLFQHLLPVRRVLADDRPCLWVCLGPMTLLTLSTQGSGAGGLGEEM